MLVTKSGLIEVLTQQSTTRPNLPTQKPSFTFLAGRTKKQVLDKGIRQKSTKRVSSIVVCSAFYPGSPKRDTLDYEFLE